MVKAETKKTEKAEVETISVVEEMEAKIAALEAKVAAGEEGAMKRVCKALDIEPETVTTAENKVPEKEVKMFVPMTVRVNMSIYTGWVTVPLSVAEVLHQAIGDRRQRILGEAVGNNYQLREIMGGGYAPRLVGQVDPLGNPAI